MGAPQKKNLLGRDGRPTGIPLRPIPPRVCPPPSGAGELARSLLDATSDYAVLIDPEGVVLAANKAVAERLCLNVEDLAGRCIYDFFPADVARRRRSEAARVFNSGEPNHYEDVTRSGEVLDTRVHPVFNDQGGVRAVAVFMRDTTERKQDEEARIRLATAIEQAAEAVVIIDTQYKVEYVNQTFESMTGYSQSEICGKPMGVLYKGKRQRIQQKRIMRALRDGDVWVGRHENTRKDGQIIRVDKTVSPVRTRYGVTIGYVSVWRDVTHLAELEKQLRQAQKMEAVATLSGGIAHDFNNILGPIILHAELNLALFADDSPVRRSFTEILQAAERAKALVDQILNLARRHEADAPVPFRLGGLVRECLRLLRPSLPASIAIRVEEANGRDLVLADPAQVHQVIMNLCTNAAHAMNRVEGVLTISVVDEEVSCDANRECVDPAPGSYVALTVADTGHGMTQEIVERIYDPFFTTKKSGLGTGLGLTVVQSIVTRLGGAVRVQSAPGVGTAFTVLLPRATEEDLAQHARAPAPVCGVCQGRILLVEDETALIESCRLVLEDAGYEVEACVNGPDALAMLRAEEEAFDLVLADVTMPEMNGVDLARKLRLRYPDLPVVLSSGYSQRITPEEVRRLGIKGFLKKPYRVGELLDVIRRAMESPERENESVAYAQDSPKEEV
ncbi:MAG: PAS domain S-box protein [Desulfovibrionaceae bacterium]